MSTNTQHPTWYLWKLTAKDGTLIQAFGASYPDAQEKAAIALAKYEAANTEQQPRKYPVFVTMGYERDMMNPPADTHW